MSIGQVTRKTTEEVLTRDGEYVVSNKGFKAKVYSINGSEYFDKDDMRYVIKGYAGKKKVIFDGAGAISKKDKEPVTATKKVRAETEKAE